MTEDLKAVRDWLHKGCDILLEHLTDTKCDFDDKALGSSDSPDTTKRLTKQYLIFAFNDYYPSGGWRDLKYECDTIEEATRAILRILNNEDWDYDNYQIVNLETLEVVKQGCLRDFKGES